MRYNNTIVKNILKCLEDGVLENDVGPLNGISERTYFNWKKKNPDLKNKIVISLIKYKSKLVTSLIKTSKGPLYILRVRWPDEWNTPNRTCSVDHQKELLRTLKLLKGELSNENFAEK